MCIKINLVAHIVCTYIRWYSKLGLVAFISNFSLQLQTMGISQNSQSKGFRCRLGRNSDESVFNAIEVYEIALTSI